MSRLYPFAPHFVEIGGHRLHYVDEGTGEPIVALHGNPTWSFYYRNMIAGLADRYRVVAPDHIGCGLSDKPTDAAYPYRLARRVDDVEALLDRLFPNQRINLLLHDWGGMIGVGYAARHPERVRRLILLNTAAFRLPSHKRFPWQLWAARTPGLGAFLVRGMNAFVEGLFKQGVVRPLAKEVRNEYRRPYDSWRNRIALHRFVQDIPLDPSHPSWETIVAIEEGLPRLKSIPTLICWGEQDFVFDAAFLDEWRRRLPDAAVRTFPDAGHLVLEDAGPEILAATRHFLENSP